MESESFDSGPAVEHSGVILDQNSYIFVMQGELSIETAPFDGV